MSSISGWECLKILKEKFELKNVPVIMYTTSARQREKELANELGAADFITKPNDFESLKTILSHIFANRSNN